MMFSVYAITGSALASGAIVFTALLPHFLLPDIRAPTHPDICWIGRQYRKAEHKKDG